MLAWLIYVLVYFLPAFFHSTTCTPDLTPLPPSLRITSPGELEYAAVLVKRVGDNLTLDCRLHGDDGPRIYVWNYVASNASYQEQSTYKTEPHGVSTSSRLTKSGLTTTDSGHYMCSAPPYSVTKFVLVQTRGPKQCARGAFWCGKNCVLAAYVCDGYTDCPSGEDEAVELCDTSVCNRPDKLNCSSGRCVPEAACCRTRGPLCQQPACCDEHAHFYRTDGFVEAEYPPLYEDRRAPDEYGFIQSTIYTVTACALIFMIAVVLLVSAICKMHMKRAALRSLDRDTNRHYQHVQTHRFPPCYETSRLLEQERINPTISPSHSRAGPVPVSPDSPTMEREGFGLTRLSQLLMARYQYQQAPTHPPDVELQNVRPLPASLNVSPNASPARNRTPTRLDHYRSPTYTDRDTELFYNTETGNIGRELNYMATPVEFYRSRALRNNLDRVLDQINRPRPLTLQLGRFQLSIPRLGRRASNDRRPDTPNIQELNIEDVDFVRLNSNDTYTLNGRTITLLGGNFENYPLLNDNLNNVRPPPYTEAMRYKLYGPPPEYLSRDALNDNGNENNGNVITPVATEEQARSNIEEPPNYEDLASDVDNNCNVENNGYSASVGDNESANVSESNSNRPNNNNSTQISSSQNNTNVINAIKNTSNHNQITGVINDTNTQLASITRDTVIAGSNAVYNVMENNVMENNVIENISSVIDNLPAIDSDVNANETEIRYSTAYNDNGYNNNVC